ncbi:MAG: hypothetical protein ACP5IF_07620 [Conexivisphaera sp.]
MAGLSPWEVAEELGASHASVLDWARAVSSVPGCLSQGEEAGGRRRDRAGGELEAGVRLGSDGHQHQGAARRGGHVVQELPPGTPLPEEGAWMCTNKQLFVADRARGTGGPSGPLG